MVVEGRWRPFENAKQSDGQRDDEPAVQRPDDVAKHAQAGITYSPRAVGEVGLAACVKTLTYCGAGIRDGYSA